MDTETGVRGDSGSSSSVVYSGERGRAWAVLRMVLAISLFFQTFVSSSPARSFTRPERTQCQRMIEFNRQSRVNLLGCAGERGAKADQHIPPSNSGASSTQAPSSSHNFFARQRPFSPLTLALKALHRSVSSHQHRKDGLRQD